MSLLRYLIGFAVLAGVLTLVFRAVRGDSAGLIVVGGFAALVVVGWLVVNLAKLFRRR